MRKLVWIAPVFFAFLLVFPIKARAQVRLPSPQPILEATHSTSFDSTQDESSGQAAEATGSASEFQAGSAVVEKVLEEKGDITETGGKAKGKLEQFLAENPVGSLRATNVLQHAIRLAVASGVPANTIVLIFLFPLVTALIAAFRHILGLHGFGIFVPAILAVALTATGIVTGVVLFVVILLVATVARMMTRMLKLQYLPRMALIVWLVSLGVFGALLLASMVGFSEATVLSIFPILILILLAENFIEVQLSQSRREAIQVTLESLLMAIVVSVVVSLEVVQKMVLLYPEVFVVLVAVFNVFVGKYVGLRVMELVKFRELLRS